MTEKEKKKLLIFCERIRHECLWEFHFTNDEILEMAMHGDPQEKKFLFSKIMENSTDVLKALNIFSPTDRRKMLLNYKPPKFNHDFLERRHKILNYLITNQSVDIPELRWNK